MEETSEGEKMDNALRWRKIVKEQSSSGMSAEGWCRGKGINKNQFYYWRSRLAKLEPEEGRFVEVSGGEPLEVIVGEKLRVRIPSNFEERSLKRLLEVLGAES